MKALELAVMDAKKFGVKSGNVYALVNMNNCKYARTPNVQIKKESAFFGKRPWPLALSTVAVLLSVVFGVPSTDVFPLCRHRSNLSSLCPAGEQFSFDNLSDETAVVSVELRARGKLKDRSLGYAQVHSCGHTFVLFPLLFVVVGVGWFRRFASSRQL